jgi:GAF domain-containing protein
LDREKTYKSLADKAKILIYKEVDDIANMANLTRLIFDHFPYHWIGFYRVDSDRLVLGPFQGPIACTHIAYNKGVCGTAWATEKTQIVADVHKHPGHIACSAASNSEIVIPCIRDGEVYAVLDIDSDQFDTFDRMDAKYLEEIVSYL